MSWQKRMFDLLLAGVLCVILGPVILAIAVILLLREGRPVLYLAERMGTPTQSFLLWKFRTMQTAEADSGVTGSDKTDRITRSGAFLRRYRLDELPQLFNVLKGDISFVGPRPPLAQYVALAPDLYEAVLRSRPGITGLATLLYHHHETAILATCATPQETHETYLRRCVPAKAKIDLIYQRHSSVCWDVAILWRTFMAVLP